GSSADRSGAASGPASPSSSCTSARPLLVPSVELADAGVEVAAHAAVDLLEPEEAAAAIARRAQAVEVAAVTGADELERGGLALATALAAAQPLEHLLGGIVVVGDGLALGGDERGAADLDGGLGGLLARAIVAAGLGAVDEIGQRRLADVVGEQRHRRGSFVLAIERRAHVGAQHRILGVAAVEAQGVVVVGERMLALALRVIEISEQVTHARRLRMLCLQLL